MAASTFELITHYVAYFSYLVILCFPFLQCIYLKQNNYFIILFFSLVSTFFPSTLSIFWSEAYAHQVLFSYYGFEPYQEYEPYRWTKRLSDMDKATIQRIYDGSFGISWPLKLVMAYVIIMIPYNLIASFIIYLINRKSTKKGRSIKNDLLVLVSMFIKKPA